VLSLRASLKIVIPAKAGIQKAAKNLDASLRWHDNINQIAKF